MAKAARYFRVLGFHQLYTSGYEGASFSNFPDLAPPISGGFSFSPVIFYEHANNF